MIKPCFTILLGFLFFPAAGQGSLPDNKKQDSVIFIRDTFSPKAFSFITNIPRDILQISTKPFKKAGLKNLAITVGASAVLILADKKIFNGVRNFADAIHFDPNERNRTIWSVRLAGKETVLMKVPENLNTAFYNIGQGFCTVAIAGGLYVQGKIAKNSLSLQTASDLTESFIALGVITQFLKYATGRENPDKTGSNWNQWHPFPSISAFQNDKSHYDAFPSGHLSTMMATVTILANNYPNKKWIKPVGYSIIALTGFAMVNNAVHWAGDYPLAIGLGYLAGNVITARHQQKIKRSIPSL